MTYRKEFPDFDPATMPAIPPTWRDASWHNDTCPSFEIRQPDKPGMMVFIDYDNDEDREFAETKRFTVHPLDSEGCIGTTDFPILETDDWSQVLSFVLGQRFAEVLGEWLTAEEFAEMKALNETAEFADGCCASHNYCDANMAMDQAWREVVGTEINADDEAQAALWNAAWESARRRHLGFDHGPAPDDAQHQAQQ